MGFAVEYITVHSENLCVCEETSRRTEMVANAYDLENLNASGIVVFDVLKDKAAFQILKSRLERNIKL